MGEYIGLKENILQQELMARSFMWILFWRALFPGEARDESDLDKVPDPNFARQVVFQLQIVFIHASLNCASKTNFFKICVPTPEKLSVRITETSRLE